jgi:hypothetical protein
MICKKKTIYLKLIMCDDKHTHPTKIGWLYVILSHVCTSYAGVEKRALRLKSDI